MHYTQLSGQKILLALSDSYNVISAVKKYQASFASDTGLPKDDLAQIEFMAANVKVVEKVQTEIWALERDSIGRKLPRSRDIKHASLQASSSSRAALG